MTDAAWHLTLGVIRGIVTALNEDGANIVMNLELRAQRVYLHGKDLSKVRVLLDKENIPYLGSGIILMIERANQ